jgi:hypothetical protein
MFSFLLNFIPFSSLKAVREHGKGKITDFIWSMDILSFRDLCIYVQGYLTKICMLKSTFPNLTERGKMILSSCDLISHNHLYPASPLDLILHFCSPGRALYQFLEYTFLHYFISMYCTRINLDSLLFSNSPKGQWKIGSATNQDYILTKWLKSPITGITWIFQKNYCLCYYIL